MFPTGALQRILPRRARRRVGSPPAGLGLPLWRGAAQPARARIPPRRGGAASGPARQQRSLLPMERTDRGRPRPSRALPRPDPRGANRAFRSAGRRHQRLFPRSRRLLAGIHFLSALEHDPEKLQTFRTRSCDQADAWGAIAEHIERFAVRRRLLMTTAHDPSVLPADIPVPMDDGGARHLNGAKLPSVALAAARRLGSDSRRARLHAPIVLLPRPLRRAQAARRLPSLWIVDAGHPLPA